MKVKAALKLNKVTHTFDDFMCLKYDFHHNCNARNQGVEEPIMTMLCHLLTCVLLLNTLIHFILTNLTYHVFSVEI